MKSLLKPRKDIFFRASGIGELLTETRGTTLTEKQLEKFEDYKKRVAGGAKLTAIQLNEFYDFKKRSEAPPELSQTAKSFVEENWLFNEKGYFREINKDKTNKGTFNEEEGFTLFTDVSGIYTKKNGERLYKNNKTGHIDTKFKQDSKKIIGDIKNSWDPRTFLNAKPDNNIYIPQGDTYLDLEDADEFWLIYTLTDCPPHLLAKQKEMLWRQYYADTMSPEEAQLLEEMLAPLMKQIETNLVFSNSERYTKEERVKVFKYKRDDARIKAIDDKIPMALDYYETITLNQGSQLFI